ncbi:MAG: DinB family protein [Acidobacteria bacterium]|nr:DinB family protein [Acidobacteriota bacterium]
MKKLLILAPLALSLMAQSNPISTAVKANYTGIKNNLVKSADKMPEELYSFKATADVRGFGQLIGHVANAAYSYCAAAAGEKNPNTINIEKEKTSKADLSQALKDAFAFCDTVYDGMTDAKGAELVKRGNNEVARLGILVSNSTHMNEHYGNIVTYMRLKNLVPPSSEPRK